MHNPKKPEKAREIGSVNARSSPVCPHKAAERKQIFAFPTFSRNAGAPNDAGNGAAGT
jgi:hypothetical protein